MISKEIDLQKKDLQDAFNSRTKNLKQIKLSDTHDILDDFSIILAFDFESAKAFFNDNNKEIPNNIDTK